MSIILPNSLKLWIKQQTGSLLSSVIFYTIIPLPKAWTGEWSRVARWCPPIGLCLGWLLGSLNFVLEFAHLPNLTRSAILVGMWVGLTGGLHLDGAMDTADGLSVTESERRLSVMRDSATGAFGAIAAIIILLLKTVTLSEMSLPLWLALMLAAGWSRWGQVGAIAFYPYLRETGSGAFHRANIKLPQDILLGLLILLGFSGLCYWRGWLSGWQVILSVLGCSAIALGTGFWFYWQLKGHTGDTYGAVVEWTEVLILCFLTGFIEI